MKSIFITLDIQLRVAFSEQWQRRHRDLYLIDAAQLVEKGAAILRPLPAEILIFAIEPQQLDGDLALPALAVLMDCAAQRKLPLILISSSRVIQPFSGATRYRETQEVIPGSLPANVLLQLEEMLRQRCEAHIILRLGPIFSQWGSPVVDAIIEQFRCGGQQVFAETGRAAPTHASDAARVVSAIIDQLMCGAQVWGTYHYNSSEAASSFRFAEALLAVASQYLDVTGLQLELVANTQIGAREGSDSWSAPLLNCEKLLNTFGIKQLPWRAYVAPTVNAFFELPALKEVRHE